MQKRASRLAVAAALLVAATAGCEKAKQPAQKSAAEPTTKTIVMPSKPLTDAEKSALLKAARDFVDAARAKEPKAYAGIDWRAVGFKRMGIYFHVTAEKTGLDPHAKDVARSHVFRMDRDMKNVVDLGALKAATAP